MKILAIVENTFKEAVRDRILIVLLVIGFLAIGSAKIIKPLALGEEAKIIKDLGLATITFTSVLITILIGGKLVYKEIEKRTIYIMLAKPVHRYQFIIGKYFGLLLLIFFTMTIMTGGYYLMLFITTTEATFSLLLPIMMSFFELTIVTALALFFSSIATPITASLITFVVYFISHFTRDLKALSQISPSIIVKALANFFYYALPNLSNFNIRNLVVHNAIINQNAIFLSILYALIYSALILCFAALIFQRKDF
jgi:ABC-type transport system involved in multi-copper enzyme maturation permease subunit